MIDSDTLLIGEDYSKLPESFVIFITESDVLKGNQPLYIIDRMINGTADKFNERLTYYICKQPDSKRHQARKADEGLHLC